MVGGLPLRWLWPRSPSGLPAQSRMTVARKEQFHLNSEVFLFRLWGQAQSICRNKNPEKQNYKECRPSYNQKI